MNDYMVLGSFYDRFMTEEDPKERVEYLSKLFLQFNGKMPKTMLDIGCGTGELCAEFASKGVDMTGIDNSDTMLMIANEKAMNFTPNILLLHQNMMELDLNDTVEAAICVMDGLNHLKNTEQIKKVFQRLRLFIESQGLFIFDVNTPWKHEHTLSNNTFVFEEDDVMCIWQNEFVKNSCTVHMNLDFFEKTENGAYERFSDYVCERAYTQKTWKKLLEECGFKMEAIFADKTMSEPSCDCDRWVIVARNLRDKAEYIGENDG